MELPKFALSIRQPWADAIIWHEKDIENRNWTTNFRGAVCIHAAKAWGRSEKDDLEYIEQLLNIKLEVDKPELGGIIGTAEIIDCVADSESHWFSGKYGFVLANAKSVDFIPCKGALGFFDWRKLNALSPTPTDKEGAT